MRFCEGGGVRAFRRSAFGVGAVGGVIWSSGSSVVEDCEHLIRYLGGGANGNPYIPIYLYSYIWLLGRRRCERICDTNGTVSNA